MALFALYQEKNENKESSEQPDKKVDLASEIAKLSPEEKTKIMEKLAKTETKIGVQNVAEAKEEPGEESITLDDVPELHVGLDGKPAPEKTTVVDGVNGLKGAYKKDVVKLFKQKDMEGLQKYINAYNKENGLQSIREDKALGPETYDALMRLTEKEEKNKPKEEKKEEKSKEKKEEKEVLDSGWIVDRINDRLLNIADTNRKKDLSRPTRDKIGEAYNDGDSAKVISGTDKRKERNEGSKVVEDGKSGEVLIQTYSNDKTFPNGNKLRYNYKEGTVKIADGKGNVYDVSSYFDANKLKLTLDKNGMPEDSPTNNAIVDALAKFGNFTNMIKSKFIMDPKRKGNTFTSAENNLLVPDGSLKIVNSLSRSKGDKNQAKVSLDVGIRSTNIFDLKGFQEMMGPLKSTERTKDDTQKLANKLNQMKKDMDMI